MLNPHLPFARTDTVSSFPRDCTTNDAATPPHANMNHIDNQPDTHRESLSPLKPNKYSYTTTFQTIDLISPSQLRAAAAGQSASGSPFAGIMEPIFPRGGALFLPSPPAIAPTSGLFSPIRARYTCSPPAVKPEDSINSSQHSCYHMVDTDSPQALRLRQSFLLSRDVILPHGVLPAPPSATPRTPISQTGWVVSPSKTGTSAATSIGCSVENGTFLSPCMLSVVFPSPKTMEIVRSAFQYFSNTSGGSTQVITYDTHDPSAPPTTDDLQPSPAATPAAATPSAVVSPRSQRLVPFEMAKDVYIFYRSLMFTLSTMPSSLLLSPRSLCHVLHCKYPTATHLAVDSVLAACGSASDWVGTIKRLVLDNVLIHHGTITLSLQTFMNQLLSPYSFPMHEIDQYIHTYKIRLHTLLHSSSQKAKGHVTASSPHRQQMDSLGFRARDQRARDVVNYTTSTTSTIAVAGDKLGSSIDAVDDHFRSSISSVLVAPISSSNPPLRGVQYQLEKDTTVDFSHQHHLSGGSIPGIPMLYGGSPTSLSKPICRQDKQESYRQPLHGTTPTGLSTPYGCRYQQGQTPVDIATPKLSPREYLAKAALLSPSSSHIRDGSFTSSQIGKSSAMALHAVTPCSNTTMSLPVTPSCYKTDSPVPPRRKRTRAVLNTLKHHQSQLQRSESDMENVNPNMPMYADSGERHQHMYDGHATVATTRMKDKVESIAAADNEFDYDDDHENDMDQTDSSESDVYVPPSSVYYNARKQQAMQQPRTRTRSRSLDGLEDSPRGVHGTYDTHGTPSGHRILNSQPRSVEAPQDNTNRQRQHGHKQQDLQHEDDYHMNHHATAPTLLAKQPEGTHLKRGYSKLKDDYDSDDENTEDDPSNSQDESGGNTDSSDSDSDYIDPSYPRSRRRSRKRHRKAKSQPSQRSLRDKGHLYSLSNQPKRGRRSNTDIYRAETIKYQLLSQHNPQLFGPVTPGDLLSRNNSESDQGGPDASGTSMNTPVRGRSRYEKYQSRPNSHIPISGEQLLTLLPAEVSSTITSILTSGKTVNGKTEGGLPIGEINSDMFIQPFVTTICDICQKECKTEDGLNKHKKKVHKQSAHVCTWPGCGVRFSEKANLKRHINLIHLGHRDYACPIDGCTHKFGRKGHMLSHLSAALHDADFPTMHLVLEPAMYASVVELRKKKGK